MRTGAVGGDDRRAVRQALDAHGVDQHGRSEDVEEPRQFGFVDRLRTEYDPMAIRLGLIEHHYRTEWEWDDGLMDRNTRRLMAWRANAEGVPGDLLDEVRQRLDDDLERPGERSLRSIAERPVACRRGRLPRSRSASRSDGRPHDSFTRNQPPPSVFATRMPYCQRYECWVGGEQTAGREHA